MLATRLVAAAAAELVADCAWRDRNASLNGAALARIVFDAVDRIALMPLACPVYAPEPRVRVLTLRRPQYRIFYEVARDEVIVWAIAHQRRRPGYWHDRVR